MVAIIVGKVDETIPEDAKKEMIKQLTKEPKAYIKSTSKILKEKMLAYRDKLHEHSPDGVYVQIKFVKQMIKDLSSVLNNAKYIAYNQLDKLADSMLQEDPVQELTKDVYNDVKDIFIGGFNDHIDKIKTLVAEELADKLTKSPRRAAIISDLQAAIEDMSPDGILSISEDMDEVANLSSLSDIDELRKENTKLKAELAKFKAKVK